MFLRGGGDYTSIGIFESLVYILLGWLAIELGFFANLKMPTVPVYHPKLSDGLLLVIILFISILFNIFPIFYHLNLVVIFIVVYLMLKKENFFFKVLAIFILAILLHPSEDRRDFAVLLGVSVTYLITKYDLHVFRIKFILPVLLGLFSFLFSAIAMRQGANNIKVVFNNTEAIIAIELDFAIVYDTFYDLVQKINIDNIYLGVSYLKPLFFIIPRSYWSEKPETLSRIISKDYNFPFYYSGGSEPVAIYGEMYVNFLWLGIFILFFIGRFIRLIDRTYKFKLTDWNKAYSITLIGSIFYLFRGPIDTVLLNYILFMLTFKLASKKPV